MQIPHPGTQERGNENGGRAVNQEWRKATPQPLFVIIVQRVALPRDSRGHPLHLPPESLSNVSTGEREGGVSGWLGWNDLACVTRGDITTETNVDNFPKTVFTIQTCDLG